MKTLLPVAFSLVFAFAVAPGSALADTHGHKMIHAKDLQWNDIPSLPAGAKGAVLEGDLSKPGPFIFRLKLPANYQIPPHWHPALEHVTVLRGAFHMGVGEKFDKARTTKLGVGDVGIMQPKQVHFAYTSEPTIIQGHGIGPWAVNYVNPQDDPRKQR